MTCICQLLICENGVCKVYYVQNINENKENLLSYSKVLIRKRKHSQQITALSLRSFSSNSVSKTCFTRSSDACATYSSRLCISHLHAHGHSCCFESFLPLFLTADFRAKETLLAVYIRVRFGPCLSSYFKKSRNCKKKRENSNAGLNE